MSEYEITQDDTAHGTLSSFLSDRIYEFNQAATGFTDGQLIAYAFRDSGIPGFRRQYHRRTHRPHMGRDL